MDISGVTDIVSVKEVFGLTPDTLTDDVFSSDQPLILRGLVSSWPVVQAAEVSAQEACRYIEKFYTGVDVGCFEADANTGGRYFYNTDLSALNFSKKLVKFDEFLRGLINDDATMLGSHRYSGSESIDRVLPSFGRENSFSSLSEFNPRANIWVGNKSRVAAHFDMPSNIACCVAGSRKFTVFPPNQIDNLYPGPLDFTPSGQSVSLVDFHNIDFKRYPRFSDAIANMQVAELLPGDALFLPGMWWHHVEALNDFNILINYWWWLAPAFADAPVNALYYAMLNIKDLPLAQRRAWKSVFDFYVFNENDQAFSYIPEKARGRLAPVDENGARYIRSMLSNAINR